MMQGNKFRKMESLLDIFISVDIMNVWKANFTF